MRRSEPPGPTGSPAPIPARALSCGRWGAGKPSALETFNAPLARKSLSIIPRGSNPDITDLQNRDESESQNCYNEGAASAGPRMGDQGGEPGDEIGRVERVHDGVVGPEPHPGSRYSRRYISGQQQHGNAQLRQNFEAVLRQAPHGRSRERR